MHRPESPPSLHRRHYTAVPDHVFAKEYHCCCLAPHGTEAAAPAMDDDIFLSWLDGDRWSAETRVRGAPPGGHACMGKGGALRSRFRLCQPGAELRETDDVVELLGKPRFPTSVLADESLAAARPGGVTRGRNFFVSSFAVSHPAAPLSSCPAKSTKPGAAPAHSTQRAGTAAHWRERLPPGGGGIRRGFPPAGRPKHAYSQLPFLRVATVHVPGRIRRPNCRRSRGSGRPRDPAGFGGRPPARTQSSRWGRRPEHSLHSPSLVHQVYHILWCLPAPPAQVWDGGRQFGKTATARQGRDSVGIVLKVSSARTATARHSAE
eukprot:gene17457-biopygen808